MIPQNARLQGKLVNLLQAEAFHCNVMDTPHLLLFFLRLLLLLSPNGQVWHRLHRDNCCGTSGLGTHVGLLLTWRETKVFSWNRRALVQLLSFLAEFLYLLSRSISVIVIDLPSTLVVAKSDNVLLYICKLALANQKAQLQSTTTQLQKLPKHLNTCMP